MFKITNVLLFLTLSYLLTISGNCQNKELQTIDFLIQKGEYQKAGELLGPVKENFGENREVLELSGDLAAYQGKWKEAIEIYSSLLEQDSKVANYHFKYAAALAMEALEEPKWKTLLKVSEIERHFLQAAQLDPQHVEVRWALIELYLQLPAFLGGGKEKTAFYAAELKEISEVDGHLAKGHIFEVKEDLEAAEIHYRKAVALGQSLHCYDKLSNLYLKKKQPAKAFLVKEQALLKHGENQLRFELGEIAAKYNLELEKAGGYLEVFISNYSSSDNVPLEWAYYWKSRILSLKGRKGAALKAIRKALHLNEDFEEGRAELRRLSKNI